jgi:acetyltransferase-like isoleucine patch superfamily enzyme
MDTRSRSLPRHTPSATQQGSVLAKLSLENILCLVRYFGLRLRWRALRVGPFSLGSGADIRVGPRAKVRFGRHIRFSRDFTGRFHGRLSIGDNVFFNRGCYLVARYSVEIGDNSLFGEMVSIHDENHIASTGPEPIASRGFLESPIMIGRNVWVGAKATILQGVTIGDNAVIAAHAVVTRDVPPNCIAAGVPARIVREINGESDSSLIETLGRDKRPIDGL